MGRHPFTHVAIDHSHSQQPVLRGFPLFKRCEWLVGNCNVAKRVSPNADGSGRSRDTREVRSR